MRITRSTIVALALALAACSGEGEETADIPAGTAIADNGVVVVDQNNAVGPTEPDASGAGTAFGLTGDQIEDAMLVDASGMPIADVEGVSTDAQGQVNALVVEVVDGPDGQEVRVPLTGLSRIAAGDHWNIRTATLTRAKLLETAAQAGR